MSGFLTAVAFGEGGQPDLRLPSFSSKKDRPLVLYEAPFIVDDTRTPTPGDFMARVQSALVAGNRGRAVKLFMGLVEVPSIFILMMRLMPVWSKLTAVAHAAI